MAIIKIKDRYAYLNSEREKGLQSVLLQDMGPLQRMGANIYGSKASQEFNKRTKIFLTHIYNTAHDLFLSDWVRVDLSKRQAAFQVTDILYDWCSLRRGFTLIDTRSFDKTFVDDRSGSDRIYPLGKYFILSSSPTPDYVKLLGWSPIVKIGINCDAVVRIEGEIDRLLVIDFPAFSLRLSTQLEVLPK